MGYITADLARSSIEQEARQRAIASGAKGLGFGGQIVPASQFKVGSAVRWPFVTVGYYAVPFDLHATVHEETYLVLPWGKYVLSNRADRLL
ncbi:hypothetical protein ACFFJT_06600 [Dyella flava]|uniref:Uncharacterized protein n=1 Tax=Dyella flava TaxID=1920170 RepID=A0ABS2JYN8_9GAMM|nr:hypothetical protein [Dyella flava]MBM7124117.1 hypothetical protein [Dyella flava]